MPALSDAPLLYLVEHAEPDWVAMNERKLPGGINDFVDLTPAGIAQSEQAAHELAGVDAARVVSSPMTRALQTAAIVAAALGLPLSVEFDLREWCPDMTYRWTTAAEARTAYNDLMMCGGEWPPGQSRAWEPLPAVQARALRVLKRVASGTGPTIVVCHSVVIQALTGQVMTDHGDVVVTRFVVDRPGPPLSRLM
jgi:broad specificity phosphatase PhoE